VGDELRQMFGYKPATAGQARSCVAIRTAFYELAVKLVAHTPDGFAQARALADLQEALWAAIAAVVADVEAVSE
jgi:hypothetical protein